MFYDFVEIGTSDFNTLIQSVKPGVRGLSIDPLKIYLDRLPDVAGCDKINVAISSKDGFGNVYYIHPAVISKNHLPSWLKGCNSIGEPHPTATSFLNSIGRPDLMSCEQVPVMSLTSLFSERALTGVYQFKCDTEGHDTTIINSLLDSCSVNSKFYPHIIFFESNSLSDSNELQLLLARLILSGYDLINSRTDLGDGNTLLKLNLLRFRKLGKFSEPIHGYYLMSYPDNYDPNNLPHENSLESAMNFCELISGVGVTFQYGRYEVRKGKYMCKSSDNEVITSWVLY
jgi:hypothetical protein